MSVVHVLTTSVLLLDVIDSTSVVLAAIPATLVFPVAMPQESVSAGATLAAAIDVADGETMTASMQGSTKSSNNPSMSSV